MLYIQTVPGIKFTRCTLLFVCSANLVALETDVYPVKIEPLFCRPKGKPHCPKDLAEYVHTFVRRSEPHFLELAKNISRATHLKMAQYDAGYENFHPVNITHLSNIERSRLRKYISKGTSIQKNLSKYSALVALQYGYLDVAYNIMKDQEIDQRVVIRDTGISMIELKKLSTKLHRLTLDLGGRKLAKRFCRDYKDTKTFRDDTEKTDYVVSVLKHAEITVREIKKFVSGLEDITTNCTLQCGKKRNKLMCPNDGNNKRRHKKKRQRGRKNRSRKNKGEKGRKGQRKCKGNKKRHS